MSLANDTNVKGQMSPYVSHRAIEGLGLGSSLPSSRLTGNLPDSVVSPSAQSSSSEEGISGSGGTSSTSSNAATGTTPTLTPRHIPPMQMQQTKSTNSEDVQPTETSTGTGRRRRLLIVANRLPVSMSVKRRPTPDGKENTEITFSSSSGGLVSALRGCGMDSAWIGWPGAEVKRAADRAMVRTKLADLGCVPVFLTQQVADPFYNGFCLTADSRITLASGVAVELEQMEAMLKTEKCASILTLNTDEQSSDIASLGFKVGTADAFSRRGHRPCIELTLQDGRTMTCTPDHLIKTTKGWIQAKDLVLVGSHSSHPHQHHRVVCGPEGPLDDPTRDSDSTFSFNLEESKHEWSLKDDREQVLAIARLLGYLTSTLSTFECDGAAHTTTDIGGISAVRMRLPHPIDVNTVLADLRVIDEQAKAGVASECEISIDGAIARDLARLLGLTHGGKRMDESLVAPFVLNTATPLSIVREYLAAFIGASCQPPQPGADSSWEPLSLQMNSERLLHQLRTTLQSRFGLEVGNITTMDHTSMNERAVVHRMTLPISSILPFHQQIGFRYSYHKQGQLMVAASYYRMLAMTCKQKLGQSSLTYGSGDWIEMIGAAAYFPHHHRQTMSDVEALSRTRATLPHITLGVVSKRDVGIKPVFDISVPHTHNFLANGVTVHNCNNTLWPLFHYIPLPVESITTADAQFEAYERANHSFAEVVLDTYQEGDIVWVHDYHCLLLPRILRAKVPNMKIGFFFHTPFPSSEIYRMLPSRRQLLEGVLSANLIGFHTHDYSRHFQSACVRIMGAICSNETVKYKHFVSCLGTYPIGIDPQRFIDSIESAQCKAIMAEYAREFAGRKVFLGIDRLDYIKGIQHKIYAFERLFEKHPEYAKKIVLVQIAVPSRTDVPEYQRLRSSTHELVGRVNGKYGGIGAVPIHYLDTSIPFDRMCALYRIADCMVITSIRDGMNLVACLLRGTEVALADGRILPCEQLTVGDKLVGQDGSAVKVTKCTQRTSPTVYTITHGNKTQYTVTPEHRVTLHWNHSSHATFIAPSHPSELHTLQASWWDRETQRARAVTFFDVPRGVRTAIPSWLESDGSIGSPLTGLTKQQLREYAMEWIERNVPRHQRLERGDLVEVSAEELHQRWDELVAEGCVSARLTPLPTKLNHDNATKSVGDVGCSAAINDSNPDLPIKQRDRVAYMLHNPLIDCPIAAAADDQPSFTLKHLKQIWRLINLSTEQQAIAQLHVVDSSDKADDMCAADGGDDGAPLHPTFDDDCEKAMMSVLKGGVRSIVAVGSMAGKHWRECERLSGVRCVRHYMKGGVNATSFTFHSQHVTVYYCAHPTQYSHMMAVARAIGLAHGLSAPSIDARLCAASIGDDGFTSCSLLTIERKEKEDGDGFPIVSVEVEEPHRYALANGTLTHNSEYIACQKNRAGTLILSEFAGAAQSLGAGAISVNPWSLTQLSSALHQALTMDEQERRDRIDWMFKLVTTHTAQAWAKTFVRELENTELNPLVETVDGILPMSMPEPLNLNTVLSAFKSSRHRLIVCSLASLLTSLGAGPISGLQQQQKETTTQATPNVADSAKDAEIESKGRVEPAGPIGSEGVGEEGSASASASDLPVTPDPEEVRRREQIRMSAAENLLNTLAANAHASHDNNAMSMEERIEESLASLNLTELQQLKQSIRALSSDPSVTFVVLTSRSVAVTEQLLGDTDCWLAAENGMYISTPSARHAHANVLDTNAADPDHIIQPPPKWTATVDNVDLSWKEAVRRVFEYFTARTPKSFIQESETHIMWHYHECEPVFAKRQAIDLLTHLLGGPLSNTATEVLDSASIVQVRPLGVSKGSALKSLLAFFSAKQAGGLTRQESTFGSRINIAADEEHAPDTDSSEEDLPSGDRGRSHLPDSDDHPHGPVHGHHRSHSTDLTGATSGFVPPRLHTKPHRATQIATAESQAHTATNSPAHRSAKGRAQIDFILCMGNFMERDEDVFSVLNDWSSTGSFASSTTTSILNSIASAKYRAHMAGSGVGSPLPSAPAGVVRRHSFSQAATKALLQSDHELALHHDSKRRAQMPPLAPSQTTQTQDESGAVQVGAGVGGGSSGSSGGETVVNVRQSDSPHHLSTVVSPQSRDPSAPTAPTLSTARTFSNLFAAASEAEPERVPVGSAVLPSAPTPTSTSRASPVTEIETHTYTNTTPADESGRLMSRPTSLPHRADWAPVCFTVTVGKRPSRAHFYVPDLASVTHILNSVAGLLISASTSTSGSPSHPPLSSRASQRRRSFSAASTYTPASASSPISSPRLSPRLPPPATHASNIHRDSSGSARGLHTTRL